jgi:hypothetical protein
MTAPVMLPVIFTWDGEAMVPLPRLASVCDRQFVVGETYPLTVQEDRSGVSHRHYFATIAEAWRNLPEHYAERFPTSEHLRKWALCKTGYADERSIVCASKAEAQRIGAFIKPMDDFAVVVVSEATVKVYTAKSQSTRAMGKKAFQDSKTAVLDLLASMVGVTPAEMASNTDRAA